MVKKPDKLEFIPDVPSLRKVWGENPRIQRVGDTLTVAVELGNRGKIGCPTHLFGREPSILPYHDEDNVRTLDGFLMSRGDQELAKVFPPGSIGFAIKHHRPRFRSLSAADAEDELKEHLKLQDRHVELVVGVERDGRPGVITLNSPQDYRGGRFGDADYPMIFVKPRFPDYVDDELRAAFADNVRTMMVCFNAVSVFPGYYNGGDPLAAYTPDRVRKHVAQVLLAVAGNGEQSKKAKEWFGEENNRIYCSELAHLSASAGILVPLNEAAVVPLVGKAIWKRLRAVVDSHNEGKKTFLVTENQNRLVKYVRLDLASEKLRPLPSYAQKEVRAREMRKLSFQPMTMAHMIDHAMRAYFQRSESGEEIAPLQAAVLEKMRSGILELMRMDQLPAGHPKRRRVEELYSGIVDVVRRQWKSYGEFRAKLLPLLEAAYAITGPRPGSKVGEGYYVPPSLFHMVAAGKHGGGLLGLDYVGHGLHFSLLRTRRN